jgi:hypothetical protein
MIISRKMELLSAQNGAVQGVVKLTLCGGSIKANPRADQRRKTIMGSEEGELLCACDARLLEHALQLI